MSAHAEVGHGHEAGGHEEHGHANESAINSLSEGVGKIIDSVRIAVTKVYKGISGFFKDVLGGLFKKSDAHGHDAHGDGHDAPAHDAHAAPAAGGHH